MPKRLLTFNFTILEGLESRFLLSSMTPLESVGAGSSSGLTATASSQAEAQYYISPTASSGGNGTFASPFNSIQGALNAVGGGNTFILMPGTYVNMTPVYGAGGISEYPTIFESYTKWAAVFTGTTSANNDGFTTGDGENYIVIDGIQATGSIATGIKLYGNYCVIENCRINGNQGDGIELHAGSDSNGYAWGTGNLIENNLIENNGGTSVLNHGIYADGDGLVIQGNVIRNNSGYGIAAYRNATNSVITGNLIYGQNVKGAIIVEGADNTVTNNMAFSTAESGGVMTYGAIPIETMTGNEICSSDITAMAAEMNQIESNHVADYAAYTSEVNAAPPSTAPTVVWCSSGWSAGVGAAPIVDPQYTGDIPLSSISLQNILVTGPNGYSQAAQSFYSCIWTQTMIDVQYILFPPQGQTVWTSADNGIYTVSLQANSVIDASGRAIPSGVLGTVRVTLSQPTLLAFTQQPTSTAPGKVINSSTGVQVAVEDCDGATVSSDSSVVTLTLSSGTFADGGTTETATAVNGVATFNNLLINAAGSYTLNAGDGALAAATSGRFAVYPLGDVIHAGFINSTNGAADIDAVYAHFGDSTGRYDVNGDGVVNQSDVDYLVRNVLHSNYGDATLDGQVSIDDFWILLAHWGASGAGWASGDFTGDGHVSNDDFSVLLSNWGWSSGVGSDPMIEASQPATPALQSLGAAAADAVSQPLLAVTNQTATATVSVSAAQIATAAISNASVYVPAAKITVLSRQHSLTDASPVVDDGQVDLLTRLIKPVLTL